MESMSTRERVAAFMERKETDRVPILMYHREFSVRYAGYRFSEVLDDPDKYVAAEAKAAQEFHFDAVHDLTIPWVEEALGATLDLFEDEVPAIGAPFLESLEHLSRLPSLDLCRSGRADTVLSVIRKLKKSIGDRVPVFGWVPQPFVSAGRLRGIENIYMDMLAQPQLVRQLQEWYVPRLLEMADVLVEAGADYILTTNSLANCSCISRDQFEEFVHPYSTRLNTKLRERGYKTMYHICGDWSDRLDLVMEEGPPESLYIDAMDLGEIKRQVGDRVGLVGKVRSVETLLQGSADQVARETRENLRQGAPGYGYAISGTCLVPRDTPPANMRALVEETLRLGRYPLPDELFLDEPRNAS